jgi:alanyl-tRNA synthetase
MDSLTIRETFLRFYEERDHRRFDSAPLIPQDPTVLLTIAGMLPFKPYFMGDATPPAPRAVSHQKCARTNDIENVGHTTRHLTFFEMLGNFSFGDYFKREAIRWAWELSVDHYHLDPERIWFTVHEEDDEAYELVLAETDVPAERIVRVGMPEGATRRDASDNFWSTGAAGPCGPCAELHYDRGEAWGEEGGPEVNDERYLEYYNLVFMQYLQDDDGVVQRELDAQSVDTGLGLERMAVLKQDVANVFETDVLRPMVDRAAELTGTAYGDDDEHRRQPAGHRRARPHRHLPDRRRGAAVQGGPRLRAAPAAAPGDPPRPPAGPARRRGRRAAGADGRDRHRHDGPLYPELERQRELITRVAGAEEADFGARIRRASSGSSRSWAGTGEGAPFPGDVAFELHDTYGFPVDLTAEIAEEAGLTLDRDRFDALMSEQRERAPGRRQARRRRHLRRPLPRGRRAGRRGRVRRLRGAGGRGRAGCDHHPRRAAAGAEEGDEVEVVLPRTPFYAEGGGQVGDQGVLATPTGRLRVLDTQEVVEGLISHRCRVEAGEVTQGQPVEATVDPTSGWPRPAATRRPTCCTPRSASCSATTPSRPARWCSPAGCASTSPTSSRSAAPGSPRWRRRSTSGCCATRTCTPT